ncbi:MAG: methyltransferase domain-containing protein [Candidatus Rokuibacteriota bacterium]
MLPRATGTLEYLDGAVPGADREASLADIHRLNTWFGGYRLSERAIEGLIAATPPGTRLCVVDIGGARGDLAGRLVARARRQGRRLAVIVVDRDGPGRPRPGVVVVRADATALPFRPGAADVVTASLLLHHLEPAAAARSLAEMRATARRGVVINDLLRNRLTLAMVWLVTRLFTRHRFARHDGPLSVRRAYSPDELRVLAAQAGLPRFDVRCYPWLGRLVAVAE